MSTVVRWTRSPDGCALLVVEDPVGVEAEPVRDALLYAVSTTRGVVTVRLDSVWDVAPDAAWRRLAAGRAYLARAGDADRIADSTWAALARTVGRTVGEVRSAAFAASGMTVASTVAQPAVLDLDAVARGEAPVWRALPVLGGWRVRWAPDDSTLLVGSGPRRVGDDEPAAAWLRVSPSGRPLGAPIAAPAVPLLRPGWRDAPLLDQSRLTSSAVLDSTRDGRIVLATTPGRVVLYVRSDRF